MTRQAVVRAKLEFFAAHWFLGWVILRKKKGNFQGRTTILTRPSRAVEMYVRVLGRISRN